MLHFYCIFFIDVLVSYIENVENSSDGNLPLELEMSNYGVRDARLGFKKEWIPVTLCKSGMPLLRSKVCNGKVDCHDGSDETSEMCKNYRCKNDYFRCDYGACIPQVYTCDGAYNCADGSDEKRSTCRMNNCILPHPTKSTVYFVAECQECQAGSRVEEGSILRYQCLDNDTKLDMELQDVICRNGKWVPYVPKCKGDEPHATEERISAWTMKPKQGTNSEPMTTVAEVSSSIISTDTTAPTTPQPSGEIRVN